MGKTLGENPTEANLKTLEIRDLSAGYKVNSQIDKGFELVNGVLNSYEGMKKIQIEVNGETREIYLDIENLKVDSSSWKVMKNQFHTFKVNPEGDITEYLDGPEAGQQLFDNINAAEREAKKLGKRLPFAHDQNKEFQAIIEKVGVDEFMKVFPGYRSTDGKDFIHRGRLACFWSASTNRDTAIGILLGTINSMSKGNYTLMENDIFYRSLGYSVRCIKD